MSYLQIMIGPAYELFFNGKYVTPSGLVLPFMDPDSFLTYAVNMSIQSTGAVVALINTSGLEIVSCFIVNAFTGMSELVCFNMKSFSDTLCPGKLTIDQRMELHHIVVKLQDLENYFSNLKSLLYWRTFSFPVIATYCVSLGIFAQLTVSTIAAIYVSVFLPNGMCSHISISGLSQNGFSTGFGFALTIYIQLLVLCFMGNEVKRSVSQHRIHVEHFFQTTATNCVLLRHSFAVRPNCNWIV